MEANPMALTANQDLAPFVILVKVLPDFWKYDLEIRLSRSLRDSWLTKAHVRHNVLPEVGSAPGHLSELTADRRT
jgi:hypothetical protein